MTSISWKGLNSAVRISVRERSHATALATATVGASLVASTFAGFVQDMLPSSTAHAKAARVDIDGINLIEDPSASTATPLCYIPVSGTSRLPCVPSSAIPTLWRHALLEVQEYSTSPHLI